MKFGKYINVSRLLKRIDKLEMNYIKIKMNKQYKK